MNERENELYRIMDNTIECCSVMSNDGYSRVDRDIIFSRCRKENINMVRTLIVNQIIAAGYTVATIADFMKRTPQAIHHMVDKGYYLSRTSRAYRIAEREATQANKMLSA